MTTIGHFRLEGELEPAANGYVGRGVDETTGQRVFLKQFDRYVMPSEESLRSGSTSAAARKERFREYMRRLNEVDRRLMRVCGAGPTLVKPVALVRNGNKLVHVTELVDTEGVVPARAVHERYSRDEIIGMFKGVLTTVGAIHGQGVVLVDVKDGNMFVVDGPSGPQVRVFDYDDAVLEGQVPDASEVVGTPEYYSPELALYTMHSEGGDELGTKDSPLAKAIDRRHDIFALGLVLHLYLSGELPRARDGEGGAAAGPAGASGGRRGGKGARGGGVSHGKAAPTGRPGSAGRAAVPAAAPWQVVMCGGDEALELAPCLREEDRALIAWMLRRNPAERPCSCGEVLARLSPRPAGARYGVPGGARGAAAGGLAGSGGAASPGGLRGGFRAARGTTSAAGGSAMPTGAAGTAPAGMTTTGATATGATTAGATVPATAWPPRPPVSTEGDDIVFDEPRDGLVLSVSALPAGKVRLRLADGRALDKRVGELKLYGLADQVETISRIARSRFGTYW